MDTELFSSTPLQQCRLHLSAGKTQTSSSSHSIPAAPCSCLCQLSLPYTNKSPAFASDFLPGLFKDALSDAWWYYSKRGRQRFFCFQETPYYWTSHWPYLAYWKQADTWCPNEPDPNSSLVVALPEDCFHLLYFTHRTIHYRFLLVQ